MEALFPDREALCWQRAERGRAKCGICQRFCLLEPGEIGFCRTKANRDGVVVDLTYGLVAFASVDPIEKKPVFHFRPGSLILSLGGLGCNFRCRFCQNWQYSFADAAATRTLSRPNLLPAQAVQLAVEQRSQGMAWTYSEPTVMVDYVHDCAVLAKKANLFTILVTNGYVSPQALEMLVPYLDVYLVDLKSVHSEFYRRLCNGVALAGILTSIEQAHAHRLHIEVTTPLVPGWNDDPTQVASIAAWIRDRLGKEMPWHVVPFEPAAYLSDLPPTSPDWVRQAVQIGRECGLLYVYAPVDSIHAALSQTHCPRCGRLVVQRNEVFRVRVEDSSGNCPSCGLKVFEASSRSGGETRT